MSVTATHALAGGVWGQVVGAICAFFQSKIEAVKGCSPKYDPFVPQRREMSKAYLLSAATPRWGRSLFGRSSEGIPRCVTRQGWQTTYTQTKSTGVFPSPTPDFPALLDFYVSGRDERRLRGSFTSTRNRKQQEHPCF